MTRMTNLFLTLISIIRTNMKSSFSYICIAILIISLCSCTDKHYTVIRSFPVEEELIPETVPYNPVELHISSLTHAGPYQIYDLSGKEDYVFLITDSTNKEICRMGKMGRGPQEMLTPAIVSEVICATTDSVVFRVLDIPTGKLFRFTAEPDNGSRITLQANFNTGLRECHFVGENKYLCNDLNMNRYFFSDSSSVRQYLEGWGDDINEAVENSPIYIPNLQTQSLINTDSSRIVIYGLGLPVLFLHDINGNLLNKVYLGMTPNEVNNIQQGLEYHGFDRVRNFNDYIVAYYYDWFYDENSSSSIEQYENYILIFDRNLRPKAKYRVPYYISDFDIDPTTGILTALNTYDEIFCYYNLSEWL